MVGVIPPSPRTGSMRTAAVLGVIARSTAARSLKGTSTNPGTSGPKSSWYLGTMVADSAPIVRPWNP